MLRCEFCFQTNILLLRHRLTCALGSSIPGVPHIAEPFECVDVRAEGALQAPKSNVPAQVGITSTRQSSVGAQIQQRTYLVRRADPGYDMPYMVDLLTI